MNKNQILRFCVGVENSSCYHPEHRGFVSERVFIPTDNTVNKFIYRIGGFVLQA